MTQTQPLPQEEEITTQLRPSAVVDRELNELYKRIEFRKGLWKKMPKADLVKALHDGGATSFSAQDDKKTLMGMMVQLDFGKTKDALMRELRESQAWEREHGPIVPASMAADAAEGEGEVSSSAPVEEPQPEEEAFRNLVTTGPWAEPEPAHAGLADTLLAEAVEYANAPHPEGILAYAVSKLEMAETEEERTFYTGVIERAREVMALKEQAEVPAPAPVPEKKGKGKGKGHLALVPKQQKEEKPSLPAERSAKAKPATEKAPHIQMGKTGGQFAGKVVCQGPARHDVFGEIPAGFRIRQDGANYYRDRLIGEDEWEKYINGAGKEGVTQDARTVGKKVREWAERGGLTRYEKQQQEKAAREERRANHVVTAEDRATAR